MTDFNSIFPNFVSQCVQLRHLLTPVAYVLLIGGLISSILTSQHSGDAYMRAIMRTLVLVVVLTFLISWGNTVSSTVDWTVKNVLHVDPTRIYDQYQNALQVQQSNDTQSWWQKVFSIQATILESFISAFLWLLGWVAGAIVFYAYILQKVILYVGYALSPIFVGFFAFGSLYDIAKRYFLNLVGVMLWPLGWGVAGLITQGLISFMTDQSFLQGGGVTGPAGYTLQNLLGVALLGIWLIFSTIAAPVIIGKSISEGFAVGSVLMHGAATAGRSATVAATTVGSSIAAGGGALASVGGTVVAAGAGLESLVATSADLGAGSLIGSLASMRSTNGQLKNQKGPLASPPFPDDDLTGDKTVAEMLRKARRQQ